MPVVKLLCHARRILVKTEECVLTLMITRAIRALVPIMRLAQIVRQSCHVNTTLPAKMVEFAVIATTFLVTEKLQVTYFVKIDLFHESTQIAIRE